MLLEKSDCLLVFNNLEGLFWGGLQLEVDCTQHPWHVHLRYLNHGSTNLFLKKEDKVAFSDHIKSFIAIYVIWT